MQFSTLLSILSIAPAVSASMIFSATNSLSLIQFVSLFAVFSAIPSLIPQAEAAVVAKRSVASDIAMYWGQASAGSQESLEYYCQNTPGSIYIISFISSFGGANQLSMNIAGYNDYISGTGLLNAPTLGDEIKVCQSLGKKVLISLGGAAGSYGFTSDADAANVATELWNYLGGGSSETRPFGDAKIDGFDLDGENAIGSSYYTTFVDTLRTLYATDSSKTYYVSAAPQCPYPDASVGAALASSYFDFLNIQFYNNYCSLTGSFFNMDTWQNYASTVSKNPNVALLVGLAGSSSAAGSGYISASDLSAKYSEFSSYPNFGGFMVWDASQANSNIVNGVSFAQSLQNLLAGSNAAAVTTSTAATTTSTTAWYEAPTTSTTAWYEEPTTSTTAWYEPTTSTTAWYEEPTTSTTAWYEPTTSTTAWYEEPTTSTTAWYEAPTTSVYEPTTYEAPAAYDEATSSTYAAVQDGADTTETVAPVVTVVVGGTQTIHTVAIGNQNVAKTISAVDSDTETTQSTQTETSQTETQSTQAANTQAETQSTQAEATSTTAPAQGTALTTHVTSYVTLTQSPEVIDDADIVYVTQWATHRHYQTIKLC